MKYIRERDEFLKISKNIELLMEADYGSGPFANDIPWGDSLVGRLINAVRRKIGVGTNILNINKLVKRLRLEFDNILLYSKFGELSEEQKKIIGSSILYEILLIIQIGIYEKLNKGFSSEGSPTKIEDDDYLKELESMVTEAIEFIGETSDKYIIENADKANEELKKLIELIKKLKLEDDYKSTDNEKTEKNLNIVKGKEYYFNKGDEKFLVKALDNKPNEDNKLAVLYKSKSGKENTFKVDISKLSEIENTKETQNKEENDKSDNIEELISEDKRRIYLKLKETLKNYEAQLKRETDEGKDTTHTKNEIDVIKNKIKNLQKPENKQLTSGSKQGGTYSTPNNVDNKNKDTDKYGYKHGSDTTYYDNKKYLFNYSDFINEKVESDAFNNIENKTPNNEKELTGDKENYKKEDKKSHQDQLKEFWEINFIKTKLMKTKEEIQKLKPELDKIEGVEEGVLVINGIDPVIELVKLFNRAYKIHTSKMIPGARSGGKVSRGVWDQYTAFGDRGGDQPNGVTQGPYRNNKVFNIWENAVLDIMKERKYQPIFDPKTKLKVGNKMKEGAGSVLRKLIVDFLDGEKMYKGESGEGRGGVQKQFLDKYFGDVAKAELENAGLAFTKDEISANAKLSNEIPTLSLKFERMDIPKNIRRMFFKIKGKDGDNMDTTKYFFIQEVKDDTLSLVYSSKFGDFKKYILFSLKDERGEFNPIPSFYGIDDITDQVYATKIKMEKITKLIKGDEMIELVGKNTNKDEKKIKLKRTENTLWLTNIDKKEIFKLLKFNFFDAKAKGFHTDQEKEWGETK